jgi:hypothetical protein
MIIQATNLVKEAMDRLEEDDDDLDDDVMD